MEIAGASGFCAQVWLLEFFGGGDWPLLIFGLVKLWPYFRREKGGVLGWVAVVPGYGRNLLRSLRILLPPFFE